MKPTVLGAGSVYKIKCDEIIIPEFPDLHFGEHEDGSKYFDATFNLSKNPQTNLSVSGFFQSFSFPIKAIGEYYNIPQDRLVVINAEGHQLIAGCLCYLYLAYVDKNFNAYIFERLDELFATGITVTDSYLAQTLRRRFSPETIISLLSDGEKTS